MKVLHTADWHLGDRLGRIDRTDDLRRAVERVATYCRQECVDVLLVAGDLFSELARPDGLREAIRHLQATFEEFLRGGGTILAVTGNHDNENFCQTLRHAMTLAAPTVGGFGTVVAPGRLHLTADPTMLRLRDRRGDAEVQFVLMPYPTPSRFLQTDPLQKYGSFEEKNRHLQAAFAGRLNDIRADSRFDPRLPTVLVAHVNVQGAEVSSLFRISENEDVVYADNTLHTNYTYVALGHIHKAQSLAGHQHVRYSGSIERMDLGEHRDRKGVVLFDIVEGTLAGPPVTLPLEASPIYDVEVQDAQAELPHLRERYPDHEAALANLHVHYTAGVDSLEDVLRQLEAIFPRWYNRDWTERSALGPALTLGETAPAKSFEDTVRDYLTTELTNYADEDRAAVLDLASEMLQGME
jgi:DNA repair protein SbcD/Mre11